MKTNRYRKWAILAGLNRLKLSLLAVTKGFTLTRAKLLLKYFWLRKIHGHAIPQVLTLGVTFRCQCKCVHCSSNVPNMDKRSGYDLLSWEDLQYILDQAIEMGIPRVTFFGGEPLLRKDICELVKYAHSKGMMTRINTNGLMLDEPMVLRLRKAGLTHCDVSIDSPDSEVHDRLRGASGLFKKATDGIRLLRKHGMLCQIVTYAGKRSLPSGLLNIIQLGRQLRVTNVSIVFPMATGCWFESYNELLSAEERKQVRDLADGFFAHVEIPTPEAKCNVVKKSSIYISPEGDVHPCPFIPWSLGNIRDCKLKDIFGTLSRNFCSEMRGNCLMNDVSVRENLRQVIETVRTTKSGRNEETVSDVARREQADPKT
jgi:MoaA/NifB/PqqE/SkfB family radical SAM enzyme